MLKVLMMYHKLINAKQNEGSLGNIENNVVIYLPDNGFSGREPIRGVIFGKTEEAEYSEVK